MPMKMQQIINRTPSTRKDKATFVKIKEVRTTKTPYNTTVFKAKTSSTHDSMGNPKRGSPTTYVTSIETNGKMSVVSCSCEDFAYRWEVALNKKKAARIEYSNGDPPVDTNPTLIPGCCAHLVRFGQILLGKGKVI